MFEDFLFAPDDGAGSGNPGAAGSGNQQGGGQGSDATGGNAGAGSTGANNRETFLEQELARVRQEAADRRVKLNEYETAAKQRDEAALIEQNKYKELADKREKELADLQKQIADFDETKKQLEKIMGARRSELISRLPEALREKDVYKKMSIDDLEEIVKDLGTTKPGASPGTSDGGKTPGADTFEGKKLSDLSEEQQIQLMKTNKPLFDKMLAEYSRPTAR